MSDKIFPSESKVPSSTSASLSDVTKDPAKSAGDVAAEPGNKPRLRAATPAGIMRRATGSELPVQPVTPAAADTPSASEPTASAPLPATETSEEDVSKIRDILFGGQMREYEGRFRNLEDHLTRESERMREDTERRFSRLEMYIREEFGKLSSRIQHESTERTANATEIEKNIAAAESHMTSLVHTLDGDLKRDYQDVRRNLYEQGLELEEKLRNARAELTDIMQTHSRQLQDDKLGREMMAGLLDDLAVRLRGEHD